MRTVGQERPRGLAHATTKLEGQYPGVYNELSIFTANHAS
jgi:hypothetical protein